MDGLDWQPSFALRPEALAGALARVLAGPHCLIRHHLQGLELLAGEGAHQAA